MTNKQRLHHFDVLKGIAILIVVMGHVMIFGIHDIDKAFIFKLTERLHMPLFFFISGYFSYKLIDKKIVQPNLWARFKQLILPFVCVSAIWIYYFPHSGIESPLISTWEGLYSDVWKNGYWFTLCLFELILLYYALIPIFNLRKNVVVNILIALGLYIIIGLINQFGNESVNSYLGIPLVLQFYPIFFVGVLAKKHSHTFNKLLVNNFVTTISMLLGGFLIYYVCYFWEFPVFSNYDLTLATVLAHIAVVIVAFSVVKPWCDKDFSSENPSIATKSLQYIGKESLAIYLLHYFFLFPMTFLREPMIEMVLSFIPLLVVSFVVSIAIIAVTLGVKIIIEKSKFLSILLLGKS